MYTRFLTLMSLLCLPFFVQAQEVHPCHHTECSEELFQKYPWARRQQEEADEARRLEKSLGLTERDGDEEVYIIPIVFHVIHNGGPENISDEQIYSAIESLNIDMRLLNEDIVNVPDVFAEIAGDVKIEFRLAQLDEFGVCTKGITRTQSELTYEGNQDMKDLIQWPRDMYLNVWVCDNAMGSAAYTYRPWSVNNLPSYDGIVIRADYTGTMGTSNQQRSSTLPHEVGHWLNLKHTWGSGNEAEEPQNCDMDDDIDDTPLTLGNIGGCDVTEENCGSLDNINNYMDYSSCKFMFTQGQVDEMREAAESSVSQRNSLWSEVNLEDTGVFLEEEILCQAVFYTDKNEACAGDSISFTDDSFHGVTEWSWDFGDGEVLSGSDEAIHKNPSHAYAEPGLYTVTLTVGNGIDEVNTVATDLIQVFPGDALGDVLVEGFESDLDPETWTLYNHQGEYGWTATSAAAIEGDKSFYIKNRLVNIFDSKDELVSATFDMSEESSIIISYKWAFALKTDPSDDRLTVKISKDCGQTWVTKEVHRGMTDLPTAEATNTNFVPDSDEWAEETIFIDEENFLVQNFRVKFEFSGRGGNNIYLDDINIGNENDLAVEGVDFNPGLVVYPNPSSDDMNVVLTSLASEQVQLELYDLTGRKVQDVFQGRMNGSFKNELVLHRAGLASGVYVLRLSNGQSAIQEKIVFK